MVRLNMSSGPFVVCDCCVAALLDDASFPVLFDSLLVDKDGPPRWDLSSRIGFGSMVVRLVPRPCYPLLTPFMFLPMAMDLRL